MNSLTSQQRKLVLLVAIVALLIPIIWLGMPAGARENESGGSAAEGGVLARMRVAQRLGESSLGDVDPASATMNLVLLGMRGVAVNVLWLEHDEFKKQKQWPQMRAAAKSITLLQPHYLHVWRYHGWDLAYNASAEWDAVPDRWYWVKEGGKFTMEGTTKNEEYPELYFDVGSILGKKVGRSDEWRYFRKYFNEDPDKDAFEGKSDRDFNRDPFGGIASDNYLAAKEWFHRANDIDGRPFDQHVMADVLFRSYPARSQFDYADALHREGSFSEVSMNAWKEAFSDWTTKYSNEKPGFGQEEYPIEGLDMEKVPVVRLESDDADVTELAKRNGFSEAEQRRWTDSFRKMCNYNYWRTRAQVEMDTTMVQAHREIYAGQQAVREGKFREAIQLLEAGMAKYEQMMAVERGRMLIEEDMSLEEALMAVLYYRHALRLLDQTMPETFPLKNLWLEQQDRVPELERRFRSDNAIER